VIVPHFKGKRMRSYEHVIEQEVMREIATWPEGREFEVLPSMTKIGLGSILRAMFGAEGPALNELRDLLPPMVRFASLILTVPRTMRRDLGPWSPWGRHVRYRRRFDAIGDPSPDRYIADELFTLVASGHETTASSMAWAVERLRRHPELLSQLTDEVDAGGSELREATIWEVQRTRPVLDAAVRRTKTRIRLGEWVIPENTNLVVSIKIAGDSKESFPDAMSFNPDRFLDGHAKPVGWIPFGGGVNRCVGAAFAHMETDITLRTMLRELRFAPTDAPDERARWRGVANVPAKGARAVVYRRTADASSGAAAASVADHSSA
jgi:cytochrome P450